MLSSSEPKVATATRSLGKHRCSRKAQPDASQPTVLASPESSLAGAPVRPRDFPSGTRPATPTTAITAARPPGRCSTLAVANGLIGPGGSRDPDGSKHKSSSLAGTAGTVATGHDGSRRGQARTRRWSRRRHRPGRRYRSTPEPAATLGRRGCSSCLLLRSSWLTAQGDRHVGPSGSRIPGTDGQPWPCRSARLVAFQRR